MIMLHTADWHIGQSFFGYDRKHEHIAFFDWLKKQIEELRADVLLVAGDVFDSPNPSSESQRILYKFLKDASVINPLLQVVVVAGNHDSSGRLEAPNPLLEELNVFIKGSVKRNAEGTIDYNHLLIPLKQKGRTAAWCMAVPYLRQGDYPEQESYHRGVASMYEALYAELAAMQRTDDCPVVAMGHLHVTGGELSEEDRSERIIVGGLESVSPDTFGLPDICYTALGHLHKAQRVNGKKDIRYAGSPLPMSFAEKNYRQGINLIEIEGKEVVRIERIEFDTPVKLLSIPQKPQPLQEVLNEIEQLPEGEIDETSPFLEVKVLITEPEPALRHRIEEALQNKSVRLARLAPFTPKKERESRPVTYEELKAISPMKMAEDVFLSHYGNEMPGNLKKLLHTVIQEVEL